MEEPDSSLGMGLLPATNPLNIAEIMALFFAPVKVPIPISALIARGFFDAVFAQEMVGAVPFVLGVIPRWNLVERE